MSPLNPGKLRHEAELQSATRTDVPGGGWTESWTEVDTVRYQVEWLAGREQLQAMQIGMVKPVRFRRRYREGVTTDMRLVYNDRYFDITSVTDPGERHRELEILAEDDGPVEPST